MAGRLSAGKKPSAKGRAKDQEARKNILKAIVLALLLAASLALVHLSPLGYYLSASHVNELKGKLDLFHAWTPAVFLLGGALLISIGAPRSIISILGGITFGFFGGTLLSLGASLLGSVGIFFLTKWLGRPLFRQKVSMFLTTIEDHVQTHGFWLVVILRQLPLTCILVNVLIGLTPVSTSAFLFGSIVGLLPEAAIFSLFGSSVREAFILRVSIASCLLIILALAIRLLYRRSLIVQKIAQKPTE